MAATGGSNVVWRGVAGEGHAGEGHAGELKNHWHCWRRGWGRAKQVESVTVVESGLTRGRLAVPQWQRKATRLETCECVANC